jgi:hypothetical protein
VLLLHFGELNGGKVVQPQVTGQVTEPDGCAFHEYGKPYGQNVLWTSPLYSPYGWVDWREGNDFLLDGPIWVLDLAEEARIVKVSSVKGVARLKARYPCPDPAHNGRGWNGEPRECHEKCMDWPAIARDYDAFWLTYKGLESTYRGVPWKYRLGSGFDCETVVVFDAAAVKLVGQLEASAFTPEFARA